MPDNFTELTTPKLPPKDDTDATPKIPMDSKGDATPPHKKRVMSEEHKRKISESLRGKKRGKRVTQEVDNKVTTEQKVPLKFFMLTTTGMISRKANNKSIAMLEPEATQIEKGWNKYIELEHPDVLDKAPILHGVMPTISYILRVVLSGRVPYDATMPTTQPIPTQTPKPKDTVEIDSTTKKPKHEITSVDELRNIKLEGLDMSKALKRG